MTDELNRAAPSSLVGDDGLPPLPESAGTIHPQHDSEQDGFTADQYRQGQREAVEADRRARKAIVDEQAATMLAQRKKIQTLEAELRAQQPAPGESVDTPEFRKLLEEYAMYGELPGNECVADLIAHIDAWAARRAAGSSVGWKPVPAEPTPAMLQAGSDDKGYYLPNSLFSMIGEDGMAAVYRAMLAAAPNPPQEKE